MGKDGAKKEKKPKELVSCKFDGTTVDAAIVSAARLTHMCRLNWDDILGYLWVIFIHIFAQTVQINLTIVFFWYIEIFEDPWELGQRNALIPVIQNAAGRAFNITLKMEQVADLTCKKTYSDVTYLHVLFLTVFCATCLGEVFKNFYRVYVVCLLKSTPDLADEPGYDEDEAGPCPSCINCSPDYEPEEGDPPAKDYSIRNWPIEMKVTHMTWLWKILVIILVLFPHFIATMMVFWTGVKYLALTIDPVKVAKTALKLGFLANILKNYFMVFMSHNFKIYLQNGSYSVMAEPDEDEDEEEEAFDISYVWNTWGGLMTKFLLSLFGMMIVHYVSFEGLREVRKECLDYVDSLKYNATLYHPWGSMPPVPVTWDNFQTLLF